jgi:hypothetical protein
MKHLVRRAAILPVLVALLTLGLVAPGSAAPSTGRVKGVVTMGGTPLKGLRIELHLTGDDGFENRTLDVDTTNSKGAYSFTFSTKDPEYRGHTIIVRDPSGRIVDTSRRFTDRPGRTVTRNASVKAGATITGSVKRADSAATKRLRVDVFGPLQALDHDRDTPLSYDQSEKVAADGSFALRGLPAGDYYLGFADESRTYFGQCYDNISAVGRDCDGSNGPAGSGGTAIRVAAGQTVNLNPQVLSTRGRRISGSVTDTSGRPVRKVRLRLAQDGASGRMSTDSSSRGAFTLGPVTDGRFRLSVVPGSPWAPEGLPIDVAGGDVMRLQVRLKSMATIRAALTPGTRSVKVAVTVTRSATGSKPRGQATIRWGTIAKTVQLVKGKGTVKLSGLPKGKRAITVDYAGTRTTAATTKVFPAVVK